jgi:hypothetical protein
MQALVSVAPGFEALIRHDFVATPSPAKREKGLPQRH